MPANNNGRRPSTRLQRWLTIGLGVKRWLLLLALGSAAAGIGSVYLIIWLRQQGLFPPTLYDLVILRGQPTWIRVLVPVTLGGGVILFSLYRLSASLTAPFRQEATVSLAESLYEHRQAVQRRRGPVIVALGGGTGLASLLRGLTAHTRNITSVVTMADDGGSSGRLRRELGLLPPGDLRNNMAALARDEALMTQLLQYRFGDNLNLNGHSDLQGHSFGNLLLAALIGITGSFDEALLAAERVLALRGRVLPSTLMDVTLVADVEVGDPPRVRQVVGESAIPAAQGHVRRVFLQPGDARAYPPVLRAIMEADLIVLGPGSLYTSIVPNLLVPEIAHALQRARAPKVYVCNLAMQPGETDGYSVADHGVAVQQYLPARTLTHVLANSNQTLPRGVDPGLTRFVPLHAPAGVAMQVTDLMDAAHPWRHDSIKLAQALVDLLQTR